MKAIFFAIRKILTLPCGEASLLSSDRLDRELTVVERLALRGHFLACRTCPPALRQMRLLRTAAHALAPRGEDHPDHDCTHRMNEKLSDPARERIKQKLRESG